MPQNLIPNIKNINVILHLSVVFGLVVAPWTSLERLTSKVTALPNAVETEVSNYTPIWLLNIMSCYLLIVIFNIKYCWHQSDWSQGTCCGLNEDFYKENSCNGAMTTWQRATTSACSARRSTSLPLPSSPHWAPRTTLTRLSALLPFGTDSMARKWELL